jgi:hypothetical protein
VPSRPTQITPDPADNILLECGDASRADHLVTGNQRHFTKFSKNTKIITSSEFLRVIAPPHRLKDCHSQRYGGLPCELGSTTPPLIGAARLDLFPLSLINKFRESTRNAFPYWRDSPTSVDFSAVRWDECVEIR